MKNLIYMLTKCLWTSATQKLMRNDIANVLKFRVSAFKKTI